jgi:hypothetical protein
MINMIPHYKIHVTLGDSFLQTGSHISSKKMEVASASQPILCMLKTSKRFSRQTYKNCWSKQYFFQHVKSVPFSFY